MTPVTSPDGATLDGQQHNVDVTVLAPVLAEFFARRHGPIRRHANAIPHHH